MGEYVGSMISYKQGVESVYKRGIGILDHLVGVQEYYLPLRGIDPVEWKDRAESLKKASSMELVVKK